ncbi:hypothetical protein [Streptomyces olivaceoviridis]
MNIGTAGLIVVVPVLAAAVAAPLLTGPQAGSTADTSCSSSPH